MGEFITLDRRDPLFEGYLLGHFSETHRALPINSMKINSIDERVTFQLMPLTDIHRPSSFAVLFQVMRLDLLSLTLTPALVTWVLFGFSRAAVLGVIALVFLHGGFFAINDFVDHWRGVDRLNEKGGSRVIQKGWVKAANVRNLSFLLLAIGALISAAVVINNPEIIIVGLIGGVFGAYGYSRLRWSKSGWFLGGFLLFMCTGPLLTWGAYVVSRHSAQIAIQFTNASQVLLILGALFGLIAVVYVETRHLISLVVDDQAGLQTLPVRFGFDRARQVLSLFYVLSAGLLVTALALVFGRFGLFMAAPLAFLILRQANAMFRVSSPLSSSLLILLRRSIYLHIALGVLVISLCLI